MVRSSGRSGTKAQVIAADYIESIMSRPNHGFETSENTPSLRLRWRTSTPRVPRPQVPGGLPAVAGGVGNVGAPQKNRGLGKWTLSPHRDKRRQFLGADLGFKIQSATRATLTISATSCTRTICAPFKILAATVAAVPHNFTSTAAGFPSNSNVFPINPFREVPTSSGNPSFRHLSPTSPAIHSSARSFFQTRSPDPQQSANPKRQPSAQCPPIARKPRTTSFTASRANGFCCIVCGSPRICITTRATRVRAATSATRASCFNPLTSLIISAPLSTAFAAISDLRVSIETGIFSRVRNAAKTGASLLHSSSTPTPDEPGRVDSAPTSIMSAPSRSICKACCTAFSCEKKFPPSEKLSGVTFSTPMTSVRSPRISVRERSLSRNFRREFTAKKFNANTESDVRSSLGQGVHQQKHTNPNQYRIGFPAGASLAFSSLLQISSPDVFLVVLQVPRIAKFIFAIPLLLIQNPGRIGQINVRSRLGRCLMRKHRAKHRIDHQFRMAARASNIQIVNISLRHRKHSTPVSFGVRRQTSVQSSAWKVAQLPHAAGNTRFSGEKN